MKKKKNSLTKPKQKTKTYGGSYNSDSLFEGLTLTDESMRVGRWRKKTMSGYQIRMVTTLLVNLFHCEKVVHLCFHACRRKTNTSLKIAMRKQ